ncbi:hypothetical protein STEG23_024874 [Scotinomys teguina]
MTSPSYILALCVCLLTMASAEGPQEPDPFTYDYHTLRIGGLTIAGILFILGILIILIPEETDPFFYDYATVQTVGMTLATIMFVLGIIIILRQTPEKATSSFAEDQTSMNIHVPDKTNPGVQHTTPIPNWEANETTQSQTAAKTDSEQRTAMGMNTTNPVTDSGTHWSREEGTTTLPGIRTPRPAKDRMWHHSPEPQDKNEKDPFYYDDFTLRKRGLLVAAVLFIMGIIILTNSSDYVQSAGNAQSTSLSLCSELFQMPLAVLSLTSTMKISP